MNRKYASIFECRDRYSEECNEKCSNLIPLLDRVKEEQSIMVELERSRLRKLGSDIVERFNSFGGGLMQEGQSALLDGFDRAAAQWHELDANIECAQQKGVFVKNCSARVAYVTVR